MKQYLSLLFLIALPIIVFSQKQDRSFDKALKKLERKTWIIRDCINDSCYNIDSDYYVFQSASFEMREQKTCITYDHYTYINNPIDDKIKLVHLSCSPVICFTATTNKKNTFKINITSEVGKCNAELSFISDSEFVINLMYDKKVYYKLITPPKELLNILRKEK